MLVLLSRSLPYPVVFCLAATAVTAHTQLCCSFRRTVLHWLLVVSYVIVYTNPHCTLLQWLKPAVLCVLQSKRPAVSITYTTLKVWICGLNWKAQFTSRVPHLLQPYAFQTYGHVLGKLRSAPFTRHRLKPSAARVGTTTVATTRMYKQPSMPTRCSYFLFSLSSGSTGFQYGGPCAILPRKEDYLLTQVVSQ